MTPTEQEIAFFTSEEAKRIQELWEPKCGDWVLCWHGDGQRWGDEPWLVLSWYCEDALDVLRPDGVGGPVLLNEALWLPRQGQLQAMLEKTTGKRFGVLPVEFHGEEYWIAPFPGSSFERYKKGKSANARGPTPSIALGRALIEVLKEDNE